jgi:predicted HAD superfamily hydrolase
MKSFDLYDTLITRLVATPADIFRLVEHQTGLIGFAQMRVEAELKARRKAGRREITLAEIYAELDIDRERGERARAAELHLETVLVTEIVQNLEGLTAEDVVVSDMYHSADTLRKVLSSFLTDDRMPTVLVSAELGKRKADGGLWDHLRTELPHLSEHVGDNYISDVRHPRRRGIKAVHFRDAELTQYERRYVNGSLDGSLVAGFARGARLASIPSGADPEERGLVGAFASVFAPVLVAFVEWVLEDCLRQGISRVFFLARDGQVLYRIACQMIEARALPLEPQYIYGSRQSLHLPGFTDIESAEAWLLENTPVLTLRDVAERAGLATELLSDIGADYGLAGIDADTNIPSAKRVHLKSLIRDSRFRDALAGVSHARWKDAFEYYAEAGFQPGHQVALVDVGWNGRMQASLRKLLAKSESSEIRINGYYLCLSRALRVSELDQLDGFLHNPERSVEACFYDAYRGVIEASLSADHATTVAFVRHGERAEPLFGRQPTSAEVERVQRQQEVVMRFVSLMLRAERALGRRIRIDRGIAVKNLRRYLTAPSRMDAMAFSSRDSFEGQVESRAQAITTRVALGPDLLRRTRLGLWPEGSVAASGLGMLLPALRSFRKLKGAIEPAK